MANKNHLLWVLVTAVFLWNFSIMNRLALTNDCDCRNPHPLLANDWKHHGALKDKTAVAKNADEIFDDDKRLETAVIILSSLIPSHPSLHMLDKTLGSLQNLQGLHPKAPIYITVDVPYVRRIDPKIDTAERLDKHAELPKNKNAEELDEHTETSTKAPEIDMAERLDKHIQKRIDIAERLDEYIQTLYRRFRGTENDHVTIVANSVHAHISGSLRRVIENNLDPEKTKYIYVIQHDLMFVPGKMINHTALVKAFEQYYADDIVRIVRFNQYKNSVRIRNKCPNRTKAGIMDPLKIDGGHQDLYLTFTKKFSDNNHFTTVDYYKEVLELMGPTPRPPEHAMDKAGPSDCMHWGNHMYGSMDDGNYICHLDGRNKTGDKRYTKCSEDVFDL